MGAWATSRSATCRCGSGARPSYPERPVRIDEIIQAGDGPVFSFEFFPPKTPEGEQALYRALQDLRSLEPSFVSVTWGAGGSTREKTIEIVSNIREAHDLEAMAHFTCVGATVEELHASLRKMQEVGIDNVLTLRGDPPQGEDVFTATEGGLSYGSELATLVAADYPFCIVGACYPESHPESGGREADLQHAKAKVDAGAKVLITQLFFDNEAYFRYVDDARAIGIDVPIVPGIMPVTNVDQIKRFTSMCGATIPARMLEALEPRREDPEAVLELGVAYATLQCTELLGRRRAGDPLLHAEQVARDAGDPLRAAAAPPVGDPRAPRARGPRRGLAGHDRLREVAAPGLQLDRTRRVDVALRAQHLQVVADVGERRHEDRRRARRHCRGGVLESVRARPPLEVEVHHRVRLGEVLVAEDELPSGDVGHHVAGGEDLANARHRQRRAALRGDRRGGQSSDERKMRAGPCAKPEESTPSSLSASGTRPRVDSAIFAPVTASGRMVGLG